MKGASQATMGAWRGLLRAPFGSCGSPTLMWPNVSIRCWTESELSSPGVRGTCRSLPTHALDRYLKALGLCEDLFVGGELCRIVQRGEVRDAAAPERAPDEVVGEVWVLGQQRAV